ncbi:zinc knuckle CX2CX4HX4C containing protein [Tanacetum coccineum]|uniref:Zinc knuckle CX2CX4HX4C containing protein n=1 Tax=Tanacetum coccineum TaxID=301880 RepID=A0ABQ5EID0_9ASTR
MEKTNSGANNGVKPLKSILKKTRSTPPIFSEAGGVVNAADSVKETLENRPKGVARGNKQEVTRINNASSVMGMGGTPPSARRKGALAVRMDAANMEHADTNGSLNVADAGLNQFTSDYEERSDKGGVMMPKKLNFRSFVNEEKVEDSDIVLPRYAIDKTLSLPLKKDDVTKIPVWVKFHKVPIVVYSEDGLSLIATQIGKPLMLDAFTSSMCVEACGRINFARALIEISSDTDLKKEVIMAIPDEDGISYTKEIISVDEWQPSRCADCKIFGHSSDRCPKIVREPFVSISKKGTIRRGADMDSKTKVGANAINKVKGPSASNSFDALNTMDVEDECGTSSSMGNQEEEQEAGPKESQLNEHVESDDEVGGFIFLEGDKFGDNFDVRLKGRVRKQVCSRLFHKLGLSFLCCSLDGSAIDACCS